MSGFVVMSNFWVKHYQKYTYNNIKDVPKKRVGVILGTIKELPSGRINLYYKHRITATVELYKAGKISFVLVSGDNSKKDYDEPSTIKEDLVTEGIPAERIFLDYAGFRTLDSVVRCKEIFGQSDVIFISQKFHNERAIFLASFNDIEAHGYNAKDLSGRYSIYVDIREVLARVKAVIDIIVGVSPKFLGEQITIQ